MFWCCACKALYASLLARKLGPEADGLLLEWAYLTSGFILPLPYGGDDGLCSWLVHGSEVGLSVDSMS